MRREKPRTPDELWWYVLALFGFRVPRVKVCPHHDAPFDFLSALWFELYPLILAVANRNGHKTLMVAIADVLDVYHKGAGVVHAGAIEEQAKKGYTYFHRFVNKNFRDRLKGEALMSRTDMTNGGHIEIAPMTMNRMAGPHEPKLRRDETDLAKTLALEQSKSIPTKVGDVLPSIVDVSTRYHSLGNVQKMMNTAKADNRKIFLWCWKETTEQCPDRRSGTSRAKVWVDRTALDALADEDFRRLNETERDRYESYEVFDGCLRCPLVPSCRGDLKRADGSHSIDEMILVFNDTSAETWIAQHECEKPLNLGAVFKTEFKESFHVDRTVGWFIDGRLRRKANFFRCLDFGRLRPSVGWIMNLPELDLDILFDELDPFDITVPDLKEEIKKKDARWGLRAEDFQGTYCDPAGKQRSDLTRVDRLTQLKGNGPGGDNYNLFPVIPPRIEVWSGVDLMKTRLKIIGGRPRFRIVAENCPGSLVAFEDYRRKFHAGMGLFLNDVEDPQEAEHDIDKLRYYFVGRYWKGKRSATVHEQQRRR